MLVDSHCHLNSSEIIDRIVEVVRNAQINGIELLQTISTKISQHDELLKIVERQEKVFCSVGNHPLNLQSEGIVHHQDIVRLCSHEKVTSIGETGLDYLLLNKDHHEKQQKSFIEHIIAAQISGLPIVVHTRNAEEDTARILSTMMKKKKFTGVVHCFTATAKLARTCLDLGLYISASGIVTFKNAGDIRNTFANVVPSERLLVETDAPYLSPVPVRGKSNEPAYLKHTARFMANLLNLEYEEFCKITTQNYFSLFKKARLYISKKE